MKSVTICIPVLKRYDLLRELVLSLKDSTVRPKFYIIDNGRSPISISQAFYETSFDFHVDTPNEPMGLAACWNLFIRTTPEERLICNDDITFEKDSLYKIIATPGHFVSPIASTNACSCFLLRDSCVKEVGYFDEAISPGYAYFEDCDYVERMLEVGLLISSVEAGVKHLGSQTIEKNTPEEWTQHHHKWLIAQSNFIKKWGRLPDLGADRVAKIVASGAAR